jgi:DNA-binding XRE family transcriptional regulator
MLSNILDNVIWASTYMEHFKESETVLVSVGCIIARKRKIAGLTQTQLAERSKVSRASIAAIENCAADPKLTTIIAICAGVSPHAFSELLQELWMEQLKNVGALHEHPHGITEHQNVSAAVPGAVSGAALGALGGPVGMAIGGLLGALLGGGLIDEKDQ